MDTKKQGGLREEFRAQRAFHTAFKINDVQFFGDVDVSIYIINKFTFLG